MKRTLSEYFVQVLPPLRFTAALRTFPPVIV